MLHWAIIGDRNKDGFYALGNISSAAASRVITPGCQTWCEICYLTYPDSERIPEGLHARGRKIGGRRTLRKSKSILLLLRWNQQHQIWRPWLAAQKTSSPKLLHLPHPSPVSLRQSSAETADAKSTNAPSNQVPLRGQHGRWWTGFFQRVILLAWMAQLIGSLKHCGTSAANSLVSGLFKRRLVWKPFGSMYRVTVNKICDVEAANGWTSFAFGTALFEDWLAQIPAESDSWLMPSPLWPVPRNA